MIKTDCVHFPLDRPCRFQKENGICCPRCRRYVPVFPPSAKEQKILIVKIGAMGDVLRTTFLLPGLKKQHPRGRVTWVVAPQSTPILEGNPFVHRIWPMDGDIFAKLLAESFDRVINLDLSPESLALATLAVAPSKTGFSLNRKRQISCSNAFARHWLEMSSFDDVKKTNDRTYQYWMSKIVGLPKADYEIYTPRAESSLRRAKAFARRHRLTGKTVVGINPGAGKRWRLKKWTESGYGEIIARLSAQGANVLLLGGPEEKEVIASLLRKSGGRAVSAGTDNSLSDFFALVNLCDVLVTGDTLALHAALGLKKKVVAIFGPTSASEIELYGRGIKIVSSAACVCCYRQTCDVKPDCMEFVSPDAVWDALLKALAMKQGAMLRQ